MFKQACYAVVLFAVLNMLALVALVAYLAATGAVDGERVRRIVRVLRGEDLSQTDTGAPDEPAEATARVPADDKPAAGADAVAESQMGLEIMRRESERIKAELDQRLALNNSILLRVTSAREDFRREREEAARQQEVSLSRRREEGFKKQIGIYEALAPKIAVQHLLGVAEPDDAAKILLEMETRKAKKIVEAAKRGNQMQKMKVILRRVRNVAPERFAELESSGQ